MSSLTKLVAAEPDEWKHRMQLTIATVKQQKHGEALRILDELPKSMASNREVREARLGVYLDGLNQVMENDRSNVALQLQLLEQILKIAPGHPVALTMLIDLATRDGDAALRVSERPELHGTRAVILAQSGRPKEAVTELESVLPAHPVPTWVHQQLADLYRILGDEELAAEHQALAPKTAAVKP